jgi:hypothetical protein
MYIHLWVIFRLHVCNTPIHTQRLGMRIQRSGTIAKQRFTLKYHRSDFKQQNAGQSGSFTNLKCSHLDHRIHRHIKT